MNLKVLIVDDEYFVRMGLRQTIDWEGLGFLLVGEAENGVQALSLIRERQPDIVITDIKMPKMDGIELIAAIGEQGYPCEIILLSGYEEFSYAKKAIEHGVSAYLLKPTKNEDLIAALLKLKSKFAERQALEKQLETYHENLPVIQNKLLYDFFTGEISDRENIMAGFSKIHFFPRHAFFTVAVLQIDNFLQLPEDVKHTLEKTVSQAITQELEGTELDYLYGYLGGKNFGILLCHDRSEQKTQAVVYHTLNAIRLSFEAFTVTIGISNSMSGFENMHVAYAEAMTALEQKPVLGKNRIILYSGIAKPEQAILPVDYHDCLSRIVSYAKTQNQEAAQEELNHFFSLLTHNPGISISFVQKAIVEMIVLASSGVFSSIESAREAMGADFIPDEQVKALETVEELIKWAKASLERIFTRHEDLQGIQHYRREVRIAFEIVKKRYMEPLNAEDIAEELFVSPSYFRHLFKQDVGLTFNEYLTNYRIDIAKQMLAEGRLRVSEISEQVGYPNTKYFSMLFKKATGLSPREYATSGGMVS